MAERLETLTKEELIQTVCDLHHKLALKDIEVANLRAELKEVKDYDTKTDNQSKKSG